jgi:hypothetical protein
VHAEQERAYLLQLQGIGRDYNIGVDDGRDNGIKSRMGKGKAASATLQMYRPPGMAKFTGYMGSS